MNSTSWKLKLHFVLRRVAFIKELVLYQFQIALAILRDIFSAAPIDSKIRLSVVLPVYKSDIRLLKKAIRSVLRQPYENWELCIADDCSNDLQLIEYLKNLSLSDHRIKVDFRTQNGHISACSNSAINLATGDYLVLLDHDDELSRDCFRSLLEVIEKYPYAKIIYSDEDKKTTLFGMRYGVYRKPEFNDVLFLGQNFISHLGVYRYDVVRKIGGFRTGYEGSQDYDLALRIAAFAQGSDEIIHIPKVLYHWRAVSGSTALSSNEKPYAALAAKKALDDYYNTIGLPFQCIIESYGYRFIEATKAHWSIIGYVEESCYFEKHVKHLKQICSEIYVVSEKDKVKRVYFRECLAASKKTTLLTENDLAIFIGGSVSNISTLDIFALTKFFWMPSVNAVCPAEVNSFSGRFSLPFLGQGAKRRTYPLNTVGSFGEAALPRRIDAVSKNCVLARASRFLVRRESDKGSLRTSFQLKNGVIWTPETSVTVVP